MDEYLGRYKQAANAAEGLLSEKDVHEFVKSTPEYKKAEADNDSAEQQKLLDKGFKRWKAYIFWANSDNDKYGQLKQHFINEYARGNDIFPQSLEAAQNVLASHKFEPAYYEKLKKREENNKKTTEKKKSQNSGSANAEQQHAQNNGCLLYTSPSPRDLSTSRMPSSA